jgi:ankyrin repeat protein
LLSFASNTGGYSEDLLEQKNKLRIPGTGTWILNHQRFTSWRSDRSNARPEKRNILWLAGGAGTGKTFLCSFLVDKLREQTAETLTSDPPTICFFFCTDGTAGKDDPKHVLQGLLFQIFREKPVLLRHARKSFDLKLPPCGYLEGRSSSFKGWDMGSLCAIFKSVATDPQAGRIICVIDSLDECRPDCRTDLTQLIDTFEMGASSEANSVHPPLILISARPSNLISDALNRRPDILLDTEAGTDGDVRLVISTTLTKLQEARRFSSENRKEMENYLVGNSRTGNANRTFIWVSVVLKVLNDSASSSAEALLKKMRAQPTKLDELYENSLEKIPEEEKGYAIRIFSLVAGARRPLKLDELNIAMSIRSTDVGKPINSLNDRAEPDMASTVNQLCAPLVRIIESRVSLAHKTVKDFLVRTSPDRSGNQSRSWKHSITSSDVDFLLSQVCVWYLLLHKGQLNWVSQTPSKFEPDAFLDYAARNWAEHYRSVGPQAISAPELDDLEQQIIRLCDPSTPSFTDWFERYCETEDEGPSFAPYTQSVTSLMVASLFGLERIVEKLLKNGSDANASDLLGNTALMWASKKGYSEVMDRLMNAGAELNSQQGNGWSPLVQAIQEGNEDTARQLIHRGADVNARDRNLKTPIHFAAERGMASLVLLLLEKGADINAVHDSGGGSGMSALDRAAKSGELETVRLLIESGAVISGRGHDGRLPLHWAAFEGHVEVVKLLVETMDLHGVDIYTRDDRGRTPLYYAKMKGHHQVVKILERKGSTRPGFPGVPPPEHSDDDDDPANDFDEPERPTDCAAEFEALVQARVEARMLYDDIPARSRNSPENNAIRDAMAGFDRREINQQIQLWRAHHRNTSPQRPRNNIADMQPILHRQNVEQEVRSELEEQLYHRKREHQAREDMWATRLRAVTRRGRTLEDHPDDSEDSETEESSDDFSDSQIRDMARIFSFMLEGPDGAETSQSRSGGRTLGIDEESGNEEEPETQPGADRRERSRGRGGYSWKGTGAGGRTLGES